jgi:MFS family permease
LLGYSVAAAGLTMMIASFAGSIGPILILWIIGGFGNAVGSVAYESLLQERTPDELRGRVIGSSESVLDGAFLVGLLLAGQIGNAMSPRSAYLLCGISFVMVAALSHGLLGRRAPVRPEAEPLTLEPDAQGPRGGAVMETA